MSVTPSRGLKPVALASHQITQYWRRICRRSWSQVTTDWVGGLAPATFPWDEAKTLETFPTIDGVKYSVPGDKVRLLSNGTLELHGRESVTINSGGEKIFAEEVEQAVKHHPAVFDAVVTGRNSERWGNEVVAIVQLKEGVATTEESLLTECERHIARYKLPKAFIFLEAIVRSPSGKADYRWAKEVVER